MIENTDLLSLRFMIPPDSCSGTKLLSLPFGGQHRAVQQVCCHGVTRRKEVDPSANRKTDGQRRDRKYESKDRRRLAELVFHKHLL